MNPVAALLQPALDALDAETSELQQRLTELSTARTVLVDAIRRGGGDPVPPGLAAKARAVAAKPVIDRNSRRSQPKQADRTAGQPSARKRDRAEITRVACEAHAAGRSMTDAVAAHFDISKASADMAISAARKEGHAIPRASTTRKAPATRTPPDADTLPAPAQRPASNWTPSPGENVLRCQEPGCEHVEPITGATALNRHCLANHRRAASVDERRPQRWEYAA